MDLEQKLVDELTNNPGRVGEVCVLTLTKTRSNA